MATNYLHDSDRLVAAVPYAGGIVSGQGMQAGTGLFGIAQVTAAQNVVITIARVGAWRVNKEPALAIVAGARVFWDNTNRRVTTTATANLCIGVATVAALAADTTVDVMLGPVTPAGT